MRKFLLFFACLCLAACGSSKPTCTGSLPQCNGESPLNSVSVSSPSSTLGVNESMQFSAMGKYKDGSSADITNGVLWSTDSPEIALIGAEGIAIGKRPGTVNVTASAGSITGFELITVAP